MDRKGGRSIVKTFEYLARSKIKYYFPSVILVSFYFWSSAARRFNQWNAIELEEEEEKKKEKANGE